MPFTPRIFAFLLKHYKIISNLFNVQEQRDFLQQFLTNKQINKFMKSGHNNNNSDHVMKIIHFIQIEKHEQLYEALVKQLLTIHKENDDFVTAMLKNCCDENRPLLGSGIIGEEPIQTVATKSESLTEEIKSLEAEMKQLKEMNDQLESGLENLLNLQQQDNLLNNSNLNYLIRFYQNFLQDYKTVHLKEKTQGNTFLTEEINQQSSSPCILQLDPPNKLHFEGPFTSPVTTQFKLINPSEQTVAFKIKTTAPDKYACKPKCGRIKRQEFLDVSVIMQAFQYNQQTIYNDKFMIEILPVPETIDVENLDVLPLFRAASSSEKNYQKLKTVFSLP